MDPTPFNHRNLDADAEEFLKAGRLSFLRAVTLK